MECAGGIVRAFAVTALVSALASGAPASAQQSASYKLEEFSFNSGGHPDGGVTPASASFMLTLGATGDAVAMMSPASASFDVGGGLVASYPPPGEVLGVRFDDEGTLSWDPAGAAGVYNLYRGAVTAPWDPAFGTCVQVGLPSVTAPFAETPPPGEILFVLVTAENLLSEEGTKGAGSGGATRPNLSPCP